MEWPATTKKRTSPDADSVRIALSSTSSERQSKRAKVDAFQVLGRGQEHSEHQEPLRDPNAVDTPSRFKGCRRASSMKPTASPTKSRSSIFPSRAQSVPLGGESEVRAIDLTSIPPSPRRSPTKGAVEIRRAPSLPPPNGDQMDVDVHDTSALLHFTNPTQLITPRANAVFCYAVNFATPRESATPRSSLSFASPLSPLTPLPSSPFMERLPEMQSMLAKKVNANLSTQRHNTDADTDSPTPSMLVHSMADTTPSTDIFRPSAHVPILASTPAHPARPVSATSGPSGPTHSCLARHYPSSSNLTELMGLTAPTAENNSEKAAEVSGQPQDGRSTDSTRGPCASASVELPLAPCSLPGLNPVLVPRRTIIGAMKPKRGPSAPHGVKRVTRSVSMKVQSVKADRAEIEPAAVTDHTVETPVEISINAMAPSTKVEATPSNKATPKPRPPKSTSAVTSNLKPPLATHVSSSVSNPSKLRQTSINTFLKARPATAGNATTVGSSSSMSTSSECSSRPAPFSSPSKLPLPTSPSKRSSTSQTGNLKPFPSLGPTNACVEAGTPRTTSGRSLTTLSHALDKLVVPPPSRPNTSLGFVGTDRVSDDDSTQESGKAKGKAKAKDDASLPFPSTVQGSRTFARPTASSLRRAATVTEIGSTPATKTTARVGGAFRGPGDRRVIGIFGKAGNRASKKTSLPVVAGSPVKGSEVTDDLDRDGWGAGNHARQSRLGLSDAKDAEGDDVFMQNGTTVGSHEQDAEMQDASAESSISGGTSQKLSPSIAGNARDGMDVEILSSPISADKGKQRAVSNSALNPASSALHALSESLSSLPQTPTPPKPKVIGTRTGLRSSTVVAGKDSPAQDGSGSICPGSNHEVRGGDSVGLGNGAVNGSGGVKKSSLKILKRCAIFVDVRTEQGDDAGSLFVDMLKGLGAKIMGRLGQTCTHIVYKNGLPHTLTRYRMLNEPKPIVVGIAWVVECAEKRARVDEEKFKIDVDMINVAGSGNNKRRRSMLPKYLIPTSPGPDDETPTHMSSETDDHDEGAIGIDASPFQDPDVSIRSREDDLPPLERARRRRSTLPGGQTRLVP